MNQPEFYTTVGICFGLIYAFGLWSERRETRLRIEQNKLLNKARLLAYLQKHQPVSPQGGEG